MKQRQRRHRDRRLLMKLRTILATHVDKSGNVMSPAGLVHSIQELVK